MATGTGGAAIKPKSKYKPFRSPVAVIREEETGCFSTRIGEEDSDGINVLYEAREKDMPWDRKLAVSRVLTIMPTAHIVHESDPAPPDEEPSKRPPVKQPSIAAVSQAVKIMGETTGFLDAGEGSATRRRPRPHETGHPWVVHEFGDGTRAVMDIEESIRLDQRGRSVKHNSDIKRDILRTLGNCAYCTREDFHEIMDEALRELAKDGQIHWNNDDATVRTSAH